MAVHLLLALLGGVLILPEHHGPLGLGAALQEGAAVLHAVHGFIQEGRLAVQLVYAEKQVKPVAAELFIYRVSANWYRANKIINIVFCNRDLWLRVSSLRYRHAARRLMPSLLAA